MCALPWVRSLALDPVAVVNGRVEIPAARIVVDPKRKSGPGYRHMAIHPYPVELETQVALRDGTQLFVRPIRPEDAEIERRFVVAMSEETRFYRFFYRLHELTPAMLGRFTQVDYDRELALLGLVPDPQSPGGVAIAGIARYIANLDHESAEFAVVVADAWHGRGVATVLMKALIACAQEEGPAASRGHGAAREPEHGPLFAGPGLRVHRRPGGFGAGEGRVGAALTCVNAGWVTVRLD